MNIPCENKAICADPSSPTTNFSSEAPDEDLEIAYVYGYNGYVPPLGSRFTAQGCKVRCEAPTASEALLCAARDWLTCVTTPPPNNPSQPPWPQANPNPPYMPDGVTPSNPALTLYPNTEQSCSLACPDGLDFSYVVPAGTFFAFTQPLANQMAHSYACTQMFVNRVCLSDLSGNLCSGEESTRTITATGTGPFSFSIAEGSLPSGMFISVIGQNSMTISGTPSASGTFVFEIRATDALGNFMQKTYSLGVVSISNGPMLDQALVGQPYSVQLTSDGPVDGEPLWELVSGTLAPGLSLNPITGLISGTPTEVGNDTFIVGMTDESEHHCEKELRLIVGTFDCSGEANQISDLEWVLTIEQSGAAPPDGGGEVVMVGGDGSFTLNSGSQTGDHTGEGWEIGGEAILCAPYDYSAVLEIEFEYQLTCPVSPPFYWRGVVVVKAGANFSESEGSRQIIECGAVYDNTPPTQPIGLVSRTFNMPAGLNTIRFRVRVAASQWPISSSPVNPTTISGVIRFRPLTPP